MDTKAKVLEMMKTARAAHAAHAAHAVKKASAGRFSNPAYAAGFRKTAEAYGLDPDQLVKLAGFWGDLWDGVFSKDTAQNLWSGIKSVGTGLAKGVMSTPGLVAGLVGGTGGALLSGLTGNGFGNGWSKGWNGGWNLTDNIGIGDFDLGHARRAVDRFQNNNVTEYMRRNGIDPNNMDAEGRWAVRGLSMANIAGEGLGGVAGFKALGAATKGINAWRAANGANRARAAAINVNNAPAAARARAIGGHNPSPIARTRILVENAGNMPANAGNVAANAGNAGNVAANAGNAVGGGREMLNSIGRTGGVGLTFNQSIDDAAAHTARMRDLTDFSALGGRSGINGSSAAGSLPSYTGYSGMGGYTVPQAAPRAARGDFDGVLSGMVGV